MPAGSSSESSVLTAAKLSENEFIQRIMDHDNHQLGSAFREVFADFEQKPDPQVWTDLSRKLFLRRLLKITYTWIAPGLTVAALAVWLLVPKQESSQVPMPESNPPAALNTSATTEVLSQPVQSEVANRVAGQKDVAVSPIKATEQNRSGKSTTVQPVSIAPETSGSSERQSNPIVGSDAEPQVIHHAKSTKTENVPVNEPHVNRPAPDATGNAVDHPSSDIVDPIDIKVSEANYAICAGEEVSLTAPEGWRYNWSTGDFARNITVKPTESSVYEVTVEDRQGNRTVARFVVSILDCSIYVPRAFSPNDDGSNDQFVVRAEGIGQFEMKVYSKWGELVFENRDIRQGWDGRSRGVRAPVDAYIYQIRFTDEAGNWHHVQGTVTLIP